MIEFAYSLDGDSPSMIKDYASAIVGDTIAIATGNNPAANVNAAGAYIPKKFDILALNDQGRTSLAKMNNVATQGFIYLNAAGVLGISEGGNFVGLAQGNVPYQAVVASAALTGSNPQATMGQTPTYATINKVRVDMQAVYRIPLRAGAVNPFIGNLYSVVNLTGIPNPTTALVLAASGAGSTLTNVPTFVAFDIQGYGGTTNVGLSQASITPTAGQNVTTSITLPFGTTSIGVYVGIASGPVKLATVSPIGAIVYSGLASTGLVVTVAGNVLSLTISAVANAGTSASTVNTMPTDYQLDTANPAGTTQIFRVVDFDSQSGKAFVVNTVRIGTI